MTASDKQGWIRGCMRGTVSKLVLLLPLLLKEWRTPWSRPWEGSRALPISGISIYPTHCWPPFPSFLSPDITAITHNSFFFSGCQYGVLFQLLSLCSWFQLVFSINLVSFVKCLLFVWEGASRPWMVEVVTTPYTCTLDSSPQSQLANDWVKSWVLQRGLHPWACQTSIPF